MKRALAFTLMVLAIMIIAVSCEEPHVHDFATEWSYDDTFHWHAAKCGHDEVSEKGEHVWKEGGDDNGWITEKAATETEKGSAYRICTVCGYKGTKDIQKLSHVHTYSSYSSNSDKHWRTCTSCGETFSYTHTFSTYVDGGTDGHYPKCNCGYKKTTIEDHVYTGTQKVSGTTVFNICDKCGYDEKEVKKATTNTEIATAGATEQVTTANYTTKTIAVKTAKGTTETRKLTVNDNPVSVTVASSAVSATTESSGTTGSGDNPTETVVKFPAGALKVEEGAKTVTLIVKSAPVAVASNAEYQEQNNITVNVNETIAAVFEFKLEGAVTSDLTAGSSTDTDPVGTDVTTYIAKGLTKEKISIEYTGTNQGRGPEIKSYDSDSGKLEFTVYHFSKYVIKTTDIFVATDNLGNMYSDLKSALDKLASNTEDSTNITKVTLLKDVSLSLEKDVTMSKPGTLDFNGKKVTLSGGNKICVSDDYYLTIENETSDSKITLIKEGVRVGNDSSINGTYYKNLGKALNSVSDNNTITLFGDAALTESVTVDRTLTLNLTSGTLKFGTENSRILTNAITIKSSGNLTIEGGEITYYGKNSDEVNVHIVENEGELTTDGLSVVADILASCVIDIDLNNMQKSISDSNSCKEVALVSNKGNLTMTSSHLTMTVKLGENDRPGIKGSKFAGIKPLIVYMQAGSSATLTNSSLEATTYAPGGVLGLYALVGGNEDRGIIAKIEGDKSNISLTNSSFGWTRPVFADGRSNTGKIEITIKGASVNSTDKLSNTAIQNAGLEGEIDAGYNRAYGLRATGNSVINADDTTCKKTTVSVEAKGGATAIQFAGELTEYDGTAKDAKICGSVINSETNEDIGVMTATDKDSFANNVNNEKAKKGVTIQLLNDINLKNTTNFEIKDGKKITINLNGKTLTVNKRIWIENANVTLIGTGTLETEKTENTENDGYADTSVIWLYGSESNQNATDYTVLTAGEGITIKGNLGVCVNNASNTQDKASYGVVVNLTGTKMDTRLCGLYINGKVTPTQGNVPKFNLTNIEINQTGTSENTDDDCVGIYGAGYAEWNIDGSDTEIKGVDSAVEMRAGRLTIKAGEFTASAGPAKVTPNGNGTTTKGAALAVAQHTSNLPVDVEITGGEFDGYHALYVSDPQDNKKKTSWSDVEVTVTGGYFHSSKGQNVVYVEEGKFKIADTANYGTSDDQNASFSVSQVK